MLSAGLGGTDAEKNRAWSLLSRGPNRVRTAMPDKITDGLDVGAAQEGVSPESSL